MIPASPFVELPECSIGSTAIDGNPICCVDAPPSHGLGALSVYLNLSSLRRPPTARLRALPVGLVLSMFGESMDVTRRIHSQTDRVFNCVNFTGSD